MKRVLAICIFVMVATGARASAESLIFALGAGGTLTFSGPNGALIGLSIPVTKATSDTTFKNCSTCTLGFSLGAGSVDTSSAPNIYRYSFGSNNSSTAFSVDHTSTGFNLAGQDGSPYANGTLGSSTYQAVSANGAHTLYSYSNDSSPDFPRANEQLSPPYTNSNFGRLLLALGLPTNVHYSGTLLLNDVNKSSVVPSADGSFSIASKGGFLELDATPEASTVLLIGAGLGFIGLLRRRFQRQA